MKKIIALFAILVVAVMVFVACGGNGDAGTPETPSGTTTAESTTTQASTTSTTKTTQSTVGCLTYQSYPPSKLGTYNRTTLSVLNIVHR